MKKISILILSLITTVASATNYYISPSGSDSNSGTISSPYKTLNKAWAAVRPGDIIYARGGIYRFDNRQNLTAKNGTATDTIRIFAYPGERPVFTKSTAFATPSWPVCLIYVKANYIHIRGIEVAYFTQKTSTIWYGIAVLGSSNNKFEQIKSHHNGHGMVVRDNSTNNLILNSDFHHNFDPISSDPYGDGDGLEVAYHSSSMVNTVKGCRMWNNADDGLDLWNNNGTLILEGSWSWNNGYREDGRTTGGDGGGFKFGSTTTETGSSFKRTIKNNIAFLNRTRGYNQNAANCKFYFYNNISWRNPKGFDFPSYNLAHIFRNNIVFANTTNYSGSYSNSVRDHNSNDPIMSPSGPVVSSADFASLDTTGVSGPRKSDGSMPDIRFMKLASSSRLIDAGVNVGLAYSGTAPDLGAFEFIKTPLSAPVNTLAYESSTVKSSSTAEIEVKYNLPLASIIPATSCYEVKVNSVVRGISKLTISGTTVSLTLAAPVRYGETVTLSYTKPAANPLQCTGGTLAETITGKSVANPVPASVPVLSDAVVENENTDRIKISYDLRLASGVPPVSSFEAKVNGQKQQVISISVTENIVSLVLPINIGRTDTVTLAYTQPASNPIQTPDGGKAASFAERAVKNNSLGVKTAAEKVINDGKTLIYPNPARDFIRVANLNSTAEIPVLRLYDFSGKLCQEIKLEDVSRMRKIPIRLASGFYIAQIMTGSVVYHVQKFIVVK